MIMDLSVTVIIPSFNRAYCLAECIRSVLTQTSFELIVVNDGSSDDTDKVLESFSDIKVINLLTLFKHFF